MHKQIAAWLLGCCALTVVVLVSGGATRLTHSGLSIVEWRPVTGILPPLSASQWEGEFEKYRRTPEFREANPGMDLAGFKSIFWLEYLHRLLGRAAGLAFVLPFAYFALTRKLGGRLLLRLAAIAALWGLQGALGWYMVASGLVDDPHVSHLRLTAHLGAAVLLYGAMLWTALGLRPPAARPWSGSRRLLPLAAAVAVLSFITTLSGGLVAGLRAGFAFNTFPLMAGHWLPPFLLELEPVALNLLDNLVTVQFDHRLLALLLAAAAAALWARGLATRPPPRARMSLHVLAAALAAQIALGIAALLLRVPVFLGVAHQAAAFAVLTGALLVLRESLDARRG